MMSGSLENKKKRLQSYYEHEKYMLSPDGVKSYGMGTRNIQRYEIALKDIQSGIKVLEQEIAELEAVSSGRSPRRAVAVVPRDW